MKKSLFIIVSFALLISCTKNEILKEKKLISFERFYDTYSIEYKFEYNDNGYLTNRSMHLYNESITYLNQKPIIWRTYNIETFVSNESIAKEESIYYNNSVVDSIQIFYEGAISGPSLNRYTSINNKYINKTVSSGDKIYASYEFNYNNQNLIEEIHYVNNFGSYSNKYNYTYDINGNLIKKYINDQLTAEYEYSTIKNPFYKLSKAYLLNTPIVEPNQNEGVLLTSSMLLSKAIFYNSNGEIEHEILYDFLSEENEYPSTGTITNNGKMRNATFEYQLK